MSEKFLNLPAKRSDPATARYGVLPVPYDGTATCYPGAAAGPLAVIEASAHIPPFDPNLKRDVSEAGIATYPVVHPSPGPEDQIERVRQAAGQIVQEGKFLLMLGGEHSITIGAFEAVAEAHAPLSILQIDAHADLREHHNGTEFAHLCVMRRVLPTADRVCQVGIRSYSRQEHDQCRKLVANFITPEMIRRDPGWIDRAVGMLGPNVYVTVDVDGFDPSIAPGTILPEPNGLTWTDVTALLRRVCAERQVVAADIVNVRPGKDSHVTEFLAARLACEIIAHTQSD
jgi:agmatinase